LALPASSPMGQHAAAALEGTGRLTKAGGTCRTRPTPRLSFGPYRDNTIS
jgi:hypothetical protein